MDSSSQLNRLCMAVNSSQPVWTKLTPGVVNLTALGVQCQASSSSYKSAREITAAEAILDLSIVSQKMSGRRELVTLARAFTNDSPTVSLCRSHVGLATLTIGKLDLIGPWSSGTDPWASVLMTASPSISSLVSLLDRSLDTRTQTQLCLNHFLRGTACPEYLTTQLIADPAYLVLRVRDFYAACN